MRLEDAFSEKELGGKTARLRVTSDYGLRS